MLKLFLVSGLMSLAFSQPAAPQYPAVFSVQFFETQLTAVRNASTYGESFYDSTQGLYRQDRFSGLTDIMCALGLPMTEDSMCSHLVISSQRYLYYPALNSCCYCCNSTNGCGVLNQTWLDGALYVGSEDIYGIPAYVWNQSGNFYYETAASDPSMRIPLGLYRDNPGLMDSFEYLSYAPNNPSTAFVLPSVCTSAPMCGGLCPVFRNMTGQAVGL